MCPVDPVEFTPDHPAGVTTHAGGGPIPLTPAKIATHKIITKKDYIHKTSVRLWKQPDATS